MTWARLDDGFPDHPKVAGLSHVAFRVHVTAICWVSRHLTDGEIPAAWRARIGCTKAALAELVAASLWEETATGHAIHDYLSYNPAREEVVTEQARTSEQRRKAGIASGQSRRAAAIERRLNETRTGRSSPRLTPVEPRPVPSPSPEEEDSLRSSSSRQQRLGDRDSDPEFAAAIRSFENLGITLTATMGEMVSDRLERGVKAAWIHKACDIAASNNARSANYVWRILDGWGTDGPPKEVANGRAQKPARELDEYDRRILGLGTGG